MLSQAVDFFLKFFRENYFMLVATGIVFLFEFAFGSKRDLEHSARNNIDNLKYLVINYMIGSDLLHVLVHFIILSKIQLLLGGHIESIGIFKNLDPVPAFFVVFFLYDFLQFKIHYFNHKFDFLWNLHKSHHAITRLNVTAHFRGNLISESLSLENFSKSSKEAQWL